MTKKPTPVPSASHDSHLFRFSLYNYSLSIIRITFESTPFPNISH